MTNRDQHLVLIQMNLVGRNLLQPIRLCERFGKVLNFRFRPENREDLVGLDLQKSENAGTGTGFAGGQLTLVFGLVELE